MRGCIVAMLTLTLLAGSALAQTQTIGPGGVPMAPGPSQPRDFTPGGINAGGSQVAPGPAARDIYMERIGPGGARLAPGAGDVGTGPTVRRPTIAPSSGGLRGTIKTGHRHIYRGKRGKRHRPQARAG